MNFDQDDGNAIFVISLCSVSNNAIGRNKYRFSDRFKIYYKRTEILSFNAYLIVN